MLVSSIDGSGKTVLFRALIGALTASGEELMEALFGNVRQLADRRNHLRTGRGNSHNRLHSRSAGSSAGVIGFIRGRDRFRHRSGFTAIVIYDRLRSGLALGMRYLGVLLMGSLIIIPATVVKRGQPVLMECSRFQSELRLPPHFSVFGSLL